MTSWSKFAKDCKLFKNDCPYTKMLITRIAEIDQLMYMYCIYVTDEQQGCAIEW